MNLTQAELAKYMDATLLKADATEEQIDAIVADAKKYNTASVCVNPYWVPRVHKELEGTDVNTCTVIGFPLGANTTATKVFETNDAIDNGADEIDMVINIGELKSGNDEVVLADIKAVADATHAKGALLKVIIETALLTEDEKIRAIKMTVDGGADYVKTSTGFSTAGATVPDVALMRETVGEDFGVKAAGGIHSLQDAYDMIEAGATRLGVSAAVAILEQDADSADEAVSGGNY
ncbi:deoxyribose-phosphate aldolase [Bifidobacterium choloepi]|uniref:Deoxyribose-phosphate aldolase n=1 Tax=Bifidobacterium choloepi TaxID=2614131 RepID=A0A6I5N6T6_9BIFI|nr:deoxyribose-phosphate aldolase [Bifidobacterium choloepi]NEG69521.1 deoxyribose-phosphate aldolase [Bifidobacterium choloepi]